MQEGTPKGAATLFFCLGLIAGVALYSAHDHDPTPDSIDYFAGSTVSGRALIASEPVLEIPEQEADLGKIVVNNKNISGKLRLKTDSFPKLSFGDEIEFSCKIELPQNKNFNYRRYLARYGIYAVCYRAKITKTGISSGNPFKKFLYYIKSSANSIIKNHIPEPAASLIGPVLFGGGEDIGDDIFAAFRSTGLTHIMAVSGFNVGILAAGAGYILFLLGLRRRTVFIVASLLTCAYVILVGAPASAVRAGIMSIAVLFSLAVGRVARFSSIVIIAAAISLVFNPLLLSADIGWQLSFAAVLGLLYLYPVIKKFFEIILRKRFAALNDIISATLAAQLATTPISLFHFGQVSLISPLANLAVVWTIPVLTAVSAIALLVSAIIPALGDLLFLPSFIIAKYILWAVALLARPGWASIHIN